MVVDACCECVSVEGAERVPHVDVHVMFTFRFAVFVLDVGVDVYHMWDIAVGLMDHIVVHPDDA